jgi:phosphoribosylformylglycinamidine cyclo-ligase
LIVQGAEPLFFLDYYATGKLDSAVAAEVVASIAKGCRQAGCALIGGETAEMPGMYSEGDYDLAGFCVGAVDRDKVLTGADIAAGDVILGLGSSGVHSNGFSLVRRIIAERDWNLGERNPWAEGRTLAEVLLEPTRIYVRSLLPLVQQGTIKGLAHITGGGILENIPRVLPDGCHAVVVAGWPSSPLFQFLREGGSIEPQEMVRTFNCGIGMAVVVGGAEADQVTTELEGAGETVQRIGLIEAGQRGCTVTDPIHGWTATHNA